MENKVKKKSNFKFYAILLIVTCVVVGGGLYYKQVQEDDKYDVQGEDVWNENNHGDPSEVPVGTVLLVPKEAQEKAVKETKKYFSQSLFEFARTPAVDSRTSESKVLNPMKFSELFNGNLKPKNMDMFAGSAANIKNTNDYSTDTQYYRREMNLYMSMGRLMENNADKFYDVVFPEINELYLGYKEDDLKNGYSIGWYGVVSTYLNQLPQYGKNIFYAFTADPFKGMPKGVLQYIDSQETFFNQNSSTTTYQFGPEEFNDIDSFDDKSILNYYPTKIAKSGENEITVDIEFDGIPMGSNLIRNLSYMIYQAYVVEGSIYTEGDPIVLLDFYLKGYPNIKLGSTDMNSDQALLFGETFRWFPNEEGLTLINQCYGIVHEQLESGETIRPDKIIKQLSNETGYDYKLLVELITSFIFMTRT